MNDEFEKIMSVEAGCMIAEVEAKKFSVLSQVLRKMFWRRILSRQIDVGCFFGVQK